MRHAPTLYRLLRALSGLGLFVEDGEHRFELTPLGASLRSGERSAREVAVFFGEPFVWAAWGDLHHSVMTGEPAFRHTHGVGLFEYVRDDLDAGSAFHGWMTRQSKLQVPVVLAAYDFSRFRKLVDVGGGQGGLLAAILEANPALTGVLYDLPQVVGEAKVQSTGLGPRCEVVGGNFFDSVPEGGDCYLLKLVIHDWDDEKAVEILRNVRAATADDGTVLLLEFVIPPGNEYHHSKFMDLNMLLLAEGGRERTEAEYRELLEKAGLTLTRVVPTASPLSIIEGAPI